MRADFSNKNQKSVLCGAKMTSVLPLHIRCFPHVSSDILFSGCSWDETNSLLIGESSTCVILNLGLALRFFHLQALWTILPQPVWLWELESYFKYDTTDIGLTHLGMEHEESNKLEV